MSGSFILKKVGVSSVLAVKTVKQKYLPTPETLLLLEQFRLMLNDCIQIGLKTGVTSLKSLSSQAYCQLARYDVMSYYKLGAISQAARILRIYRKAKRKRSDITEPCARRLQLMTCYGFKIRDGKLFLPSHLQSILIPLNSYMLKTLSIPVQTVRSITLTASTVGVAFSKETVMVEPTGLIGIDSNLNNITTADSTGKTKQYDLSKATEIKAKYRHVKSRFIRNDVRVRRRLFRKYGEKQRNTVNYILHNVSNRIVKDAKNKRYAIVMENLNGLRKLYRKGNGQGR